MKKINFDKSMLGVIFLLAWPTMLEEMMQTAVQYIDTAMVGSLGTQATAAVGATSTVNWMVGATVSAIGVGFLAIMSQAYGAGKREEVRRMAAQAVLMTGIIGSLFTALTVGLSGKVPVWMQVAPSIRDMAARYFLILYTPMLFRSASIILGTVLRSVGDTKTPMRVGVVVNILNVVGNFLLIYPTRTIGGMTIWGAGWGIQGAAAASALSYAFGGIAITTALFRHGEISPVGQSFKPDWSILRPCFRVAIPNMFQRCATSMGYVAFASMINALGDISTAAHTVANTVESAFYIPGYGMMTAAGTLAGNALGARDEERLDRLAATIIPLEIGLMVVSGSLLFIFAPQLIRIFSKDEQVIRLGVTVLRMVAVSEPFYGVPIVIEGMMQGVGNTTPPLIFNVTGMWLIRILGTFICTRLLGLGLVAAWGCMIGHNLLLFVLFTAQYRSGKWKHALKLAA